jgi:ribosome biogenesis GTPase A
MFAADISSVIERLLRVLLVRQCRLFVYVKQPILVIKTEQLDALCSGFALDICRLHVLLCWPFVCLILSLAHLSLPCVQGSLLSLLRQLARLKSDRQAISVGFVGYPNVGKSSVINTLRTKKVS